jgi:hypothetical protein
MTISVETYGVMWCDVMWRDATRHDETWGGVTPRHVMWCQETLKGNNISKLHRKTFTRKTVEPVTSNRKLQYNIMYKNMPIYAMNGRRYQSDVQKREKRNRETRIGVANDGVGLRLCFCLSCCNNSLLGQTLWATSRSTLTQRLNKLQLLFSVKLKERGIFIHGDLQ